MLFLWGIEIIVSVVSVERMKHGCLGRLVVVW